MLTAAYSLLGIRLVGGELVMAPDTFVRDRKLHLRRLHFRGKELGGERSLTAEAPADAAC